MALRQRFMFSVDQPSEEVVGMVSDKGIDGRVSFEDVVGVTPTRKTASLEKVKKLIRMHRGTHNVRTAFIYRRVLVSSPYN